MPRPWTSRMIVGLAVCLVGVVRPAAGDEPGASPVAPGAAVATSARRTPVVEAVRRVMPCVVSITSEKRAGTGTRWPFSTEESQRPRVSGMGTGVLLDERGYILTNQHVVDQVNGIEVHLSDGSQYPARVIQQDPSMDIALIKVEAGRPLQAIRIGTSADLLVGETVITIGNAFGYENTVSVGIVSQLNRNVTLSDDQVYRNLIQTDACINPGNSGGPLVNIDGELIGINVAVRAGAQGIGFALPIDDVKRVALDMLSTKRLAATWHGLVPGEVFEGTGRSIVVADVQAGSPAETSGFRRGDKLVRVGALPVGSPIDLERGLLDLKPGQQAEVVVMRAGQEQAIPLSVQALPRPTAENDDRIWRLLGVRIQPVTREYVATVSPKFRGGLYVRDVSPGSPADRAMIRQGDILVGMKVGDRDWETIQPDNLLYILSRPEMGRTTMMPLYFVRSNRFVEGVLSLAEPAATASARR